MKKLGHKLLVVGMSMMMYSGWGQEVAAASHIETSKQIFSWTQQPMLDYEEAATLCQALEIDEIYQYIPNAYFFDEPIAIASFVEGIKEESGEQVEVAFLTGEPYWYSRPDIIKTRIDYLATYNQKEGQNAPITKIVLDIEPWVLGEEVRWENHYKATLKSIYPYAKEKGIEVSLVIPFWLDTNDKIASGNSLLRTIFDYTDEVVVMNYNRYVFDTAMDTEIKLAKEKGKRIISAAECQEVNEAYGVIEHITYANEGLDILQQDWNKLSKKYQYDQLGFAYHHYEAIKALVEKDKKDKKP